jgi:hypothetical protein
MEFEKVCHKECMMVDLFLFINIFEENLKACEEYQEIFSRG